jgi:hypothetical protein
VQDLRFSLVMDSMRPLSRRISTTCLFSRDGDGDGIGLGSTDGEAVEEEKVRNGKKILEEEVEAARRKVLEGLGPERKKVREAASAMATAAMWVDDLWFWRVGFVNERKCDNVSVSFSGSGSGSGSGIEIRC